VTLLNNKKSKFLNIGLEKILFEDHIIGIFDLDSITVKKDSRDFINKAQKKGQIEDLTTDLPVTAIVCDGVDSKQNLILTSFSLSALSGRMTKDFP
jgi:regulator of extracellular matrix RemA (YlzA/DUF370 family)